MKGLKFVFLFIAIFFLFACPAFAQESSADRYWNEYLEAAPEGSVSENPEDVSLGIGVESLFSEMLAALDDGLGEAASFLIMLLGLSLIMATSESVTPIENSALAKNSGAAVSIISSVLIFSRIG